MDSIDFFHREINEHRLVTARTADQLGDAFKLALRIWTECVRQGGKILFFGNGGSAADAQHLSTELTIRYGEDRVALPGLALTTDSSALTACGNDLGFERIFERQIEALGKPGDVAFGISTSGRSENVVRALKFAQSRRLRTIALTGGDGGLVKDHCDVALIVPSQVTARIQEMHIMLGQMLCAGLEQELGMVPIRGGSP